MANEVIERIRPVDAIAALRRVTTNTSKDVDADTATVAQFIAERHYESAPNANTGLPCLYCGEKQETLNIERVDDGVNVRVATCAKSKDLAALRKILRSFEDR